MILQALTQYYDRYTEQLAPPGWEYKGIHFLIVLDNNGRVVGINDTREEEGEKQRPKVFLVPQAIKRSVNIAANLLWDNPEYALGIPLKGRDARVKAQHQQFIERVNKLALSDVPDIAAVLAFLRRSNKSAALETFPEWEEMLKDGMLLSFKLAGAQEPVFRHPAVTAVVTSLKDAPLPEASAAICLVTGKRDVMARLHPAIRGVRNASSMGANIVSFNEDAFCSYGKKQGFNAPVGEAASLAYTTSINALLGKDSKQKLQIGDATTVFWSEKPTRLENDFALFFTEPPKDNPHRGPDAVNALFDSPRTGAWLETEGNTHFHVLGLAPNVARIAIRFWITDTVANMAGHIRRHFVDTDIAHAPHERDHPSLLRLLKQAAVMEKEENIPNHLAGETARSVFTGTRYPATLLAALLRRIKAEHAVPYPRAAFIKACVNRITRTDPHSQEKELTVSLDTNNTNQGYLLGRLFAVLERAQELANGEASIASRYYGAASSAPSTVFGTLLRLLRHHLAKIEYHGTRVNLEKLFGEIMAGLADFPSILPLADQGRFAIGYYHQRQDFFTKKEEK